MERKSNVWAITLAVIITAVVVGGGVYWWQQSKVAQEGVTTDTAADKEEPKEPLSYSTNGVPVSVSKETTSFPYSAYQLVSMAEECGSQHSAGYFDQLVTKFSGATTMKYIFRYTGVSQDSGTFMVTLLPNQAGYASLNQFKKDFDTCAAGGDAYPTMLNDNWLLFVSACGTGFDDGSGRPHGCQEISDVVEPTLELN